MMQNFFTNLILCTSLLICHGCATTLGYNVQINALVHPTNQPGVKYILVNEYYEDENRDKLLDQDFSFYIHNALKLTGYQRVYDPSEADIAINFVYSVGEPRENFYTYITPQFGQTGVTSNTTGTLYSFGGGLSQFSGTTNYNPQYGITGFSSHVGSYITYDIQVGLSAINYQEYLQNEQIQESWRLQLSSTDRNGDLRKVFPLMLSAAKDYIGQSSNETITVFIAENNPIVFEIKGIKSKK